MHFRMKCACEGYPSRTLLKLGRGMQVFTALYNTDDNCLVAAPTGSGKTACAEFAVLRMIQKASQDKGAARCVYIAPLPGLAKERMADWSAKASIRLNIALHTAPMHSFTQWASGLRVGQASSIV